mmetsp:Transcript_22405/g.52825  ORF Transcript_22405/g.52825 Transcript_22405/m.52825 type:complete len:229 (+) Transcript_22405:3925-4611(+)
MTLCSPSPGTSGPLTTTVTPISCQNGSVFCLYSTHFWVANDNFNIKSVPGVIQFESKTVLPAGADEDFASFSLLLFFPLLVKLSRDSKDDASFSASFADRNRRERCWFILARGATPSTAKYNTFVGLTNLYNRSTYRKIFLNIAVSSNMICVPSSFELPCVHGWMIPFISKYKLSTFTSSVKPISVTMSGYWSVKYRNILGIPNNAVVVDDDGDDGDSTGVVVEGGVL